MNAIAHLHLTTHDSGIAAISSLPLALDWLSIALPPTPPPPDPLSPNQARASLVRSHYPSNSREVFAPCFCIAGRFMLGRTLGNLYLPSEMNLPSNDICAESRFVLDLQHGSVVELRRYASGVIFCVGQAARRVEFLSVGGVGFGQRVEITYQGGGELEGVLGPLNWGDFCANYARVLPTGDLTASVRSEPGAQGVVFKKERIVVTMDDSFARNFADGGGGGGRRIMPRRLLPRPAS